jgi:hypothetical protein
LNNIQLFYLEHVRTDRKENIVTLLLFTFVAVETLLFVQLLLNNEISRFISLYAVRLRAHTKELIATLSEPPTHNRLRRYWPNDLLTRF